MRSRHSLSQLLGFAVLVTLSLLAVTALGWSAYGTQMNQHAADLLFRLRGEQKAGVERIAIVAIDDETLARFGNLPLDRSLVAAALTRICSGRPNVIALDLLFPEPSNPEADQALLGALRACPQTVLAGGLVKEDPADPQPARWLHPLPPFAEAAAAIGHVHADPDLDGVSRRILLAKSVAGERRWALALEALRIQTGQSGPVVEDERTLAVSSHMIPASRERQRALLINYAGGEGVFPRYSLGQVATGEVASDTFAGRAVLLGVTAQGAGDRLFTPFSSPGRGMPGVEIHAHILHMLMTDSFPRAAARDNVARHHGGHCRRGGGRLCGRSRASGWLWPWPWLPLPPTPCLTFCSPAGNCSRPPSPSRWPCGDHCWSVASSST